MHKRPNNVSTKWWNSAKKIIAAVGMVDGQLRYNHRRRMTAAEIAEAAGLRRAQAYAMLAQLVAMRIIGRKVTIEKFGHRVGAETWVCDPEKQIDYTQPPRTARVAAVLPQIRQALKEDRESLRVVAKRFGVSADTVQDERRKIAPYDPDSAAMWRCPNCGALITSPSCLRCSLI